VVEALEILERSEAHGHVPAPVLVVLPDPDARVDVRRPILGRPSHERLRLAASHAGFVETILAPGTRLPVPEPSSRPFGSDADVPVPEAGTLAAKLHAREVATAERIDRPALVVYEGTFVHPQLLALMVAHPLDPDERFTLYDEVGRPAACFYGDLGVVPGMLPLTEELTYPDEHGPTDVVRVVYPEDIARIEALVLRAEDVPVHTTPGWRQKIELPTLRWMADSRRPLAQLNLFGLTFVAAALPLALLGGVLGLCGAAASLLLGVHITRLVPIVRRLRAAGTAEARESVDEHLAAAARPLGHAALMGGLTYTIVAQTSRSGVAAVVLLVAGAGAVLLGLFQARLILRGRPADVFALPDVESAVKRLGVAWPPVLRGAPLMELVVLVASVAGIAELPWSVLAAGAAARLWRWFAGPPVARGGGRSDESVTLT
jgi:hypothetical protein